MRSIRLQIMALIGSLLLVLLLLLNYLPLTTSRDLIFEEKHRSMVSGAQVVASSLSGLDSLNSAGIREVLSLLDVKGYTGISVLDANGDLLYRSGQPKTPDGDKLATAAAGNTVFLSSYESRVFTSTCLVPVRTGGTVSGIVCLYERDADQGNIIYRIQYRMRLLSLILGAVFLALAAVLSTVLLRRLRALTASMRIVAGGDYSHRLAVQGRDEVAELGNEFNSLTERLDTTEQQRRRFVSDASHELKTPLASIRLLSDSIVQTGNMDSDTMREFVADIGNEAERLQRTTEKLLDLSRLDDGVQVVPVPVDVKQVTLDAIAVLRPLANEKNVLLRCSLQDGCVIMATTEDLFHILFNLMENAVKYNEPGGSVRITLEADSSSVRFSVADTGIGIPEADRLNIFTRFYRVDKARSREAGGSGLGLSIVHDAVLAHGGTIAVGENKPKGSVFIVTFPRPSAEETGI